MVRAAGAAILNPKEHDMLVSLADFCYRRRRLVVVLWIAALMGSFALAGAFGGEYKQDYLQPGSESKAAADTLADRFPQQAGDTVQIVVHADEGVSSGEARARAERIFADVAGNEHVVGVVSPFSDEGGAQISADGTTAYADVAVDRTGQRVHARGGQGPGRTGARRRRRGPPGGGGRPGRRALADGPFGSEGIGLIAAAVILLFTFGSAVAMGLPLVTALFGLGSAVALGELLRRVVDVPDWAPATAAMVGLGVGIDYALLIVTRFRSGLAEGQEPRRATLSAIGTAGRAVVFAGLTVLVSMLGILLVGQAALNGFAFTVSLAVLAHHARLGDAPARAPGLRRPQHRTPARAVREQRTRMPDDTSRWFRWSRFVQRLPVGCGRRRARPCCSRLAAPFLGIRLGFPDAQNDPPSYTTHRAYDLLADGFGPGFSAPLAAHRPGRVGRRAAGLRRRAGGQAARGSTAWPFVGPASRQRGR
jgi:RND superfamily putative drug exporter